MIQFSRSASKTRHSRGRDLQRLVLCAFAACGLMAAGPALAQKTATPVIVEPTGNPKPAYSKDREPSAQQLIETWRWSNEVMPGKKVEIQVFYQLSTDLNAWVPHHTRGESSETLCSDAKLWTADQVARLIDPP